MSLLQKALKYANKKSKESEEVVNSWIEEFQNCNSTNDFENSVFDKFTYGIPVDIPIDIHNNIKKDVDNILELLGVTQEDIDNGFVEIEYEEVLNNKTSSKYELKIGDILSINNGEFAVLIVQTEFYPPKYMPIIIGGSEIFEYEKYQCETAEQFNSPDEIYEYYLNYCNQVEIIKNSNTDWRNY